MNKPPLSHFDVLERGFLHFLQWTNGKFYGIMFRKEEGKEGMKHEKDPIQVHAEFMADNMNVPNVPNMVLLILYDLRIPVKCAGFRYLKDVLPLALQNPSQIVESELYAKVGSQYIPEVCIQNMDFSIRDVLQKAWSVHTYSTWRKYMPEYIMERENGPTSLEFIACIAYFLEFWQNCYEKEAGHERI